LNTQLTLWTVVLAVVVSLSGCGSPNQRHTLLREAGLTEPSARIEWDGSLYEVLFDGAVCARFALPTLTGCGLPEVDITSLEDGWQQVRLRWDVAAETTQDDLSVRLELPFDPDLWWAPHLAPYEGYVVAQHVFRSPALIVQQGARVLALVPDLDAVGSQPGNPWYLDYDAPKRMLRVGMTRTEIPEHVLFKRTPGMTFSPGPVELSFFLTVYEDHAAVKNPWARTAEFLWHRWAKPLYERGEPIAAPLETYVQRTYEWAFRGWGDSVWQQFELEGVVVGAPQFIVNISQSPNYPGHWYQREFLSIWNQAWFSSLRSASGLYRYAQDHGDTELLRRASLTKELALAAPMRDGLFPAVIATHNKTVEEDGQLYPRPGDWAEAFWSNSNRCPHEHGITPAWIHLLDSSWTALLMLRWYEELEPDERLLHFARSYGERLVTLQDADGFFPGWVHPDTGKPGPVMNQTPETSLSVSFLLKLADLTGTPTYRQAALRAMDAVLAGPVPDGLWLDFETFWSCCRWGQEKYLGRKIERNALHKQNTLSMFWTAEALLDAYRATGQSHYLAWGRRTLDELSMSQQVWQPPFIHVPALGGFGVMNADGEWNDARQTLFAELFLDYYRETGHPPYFERGVAALKAGFVMMYCPENPTVKAMWEKVYPWFGPEDYGFTMENYGHGGQTSPEGEGMGVFTIYDWGNGAAAQAATRILRRYGHVYIDQSRGRAFGLDQVAVRPREQGWEMINQADQPRIIRVVYDDGRSVKHRLD
jgi:hypothetical protein